MATMVGSASMAAPDWAWAAPNASAAKDTATRASGGRLRAPGDTRPRATCPFTLADRDETRRCASGGLLACGMLALQSVGVAVGSARTPTQPGDRSVVFLEAVGVLLAERFGEPADLSVAVAPLHVVAVRFGDVVALGALVERAGGAGRERYGQNLLFRTVVVPVKRDADACAYRDTAARPLGAAAVVVRDGVRGGDAGVVVDQLTVDPPGDDRMGALRTLDEVPPFVLDVGKWLLLLAGTAHAGGDGVEFSGVQGAEVLTLRGRVGGREGHKEQQVDRP